MIVAAASVRSVNKFRKNLCVVYDDEEDDDDEIKYI